MAETGLFYSVLPRRTYVIRTENKRTLRGVKAMKSKDGITAYICTNADGTEKLSLSIISTAKSPLAFELGQCPIAYFQNKTERSNGIKNSL